MRWIGTGLFISGLIAGLLTGWFSRDFFLASFSQSQSQSLIKPNSDFAIVTSDTVQQGVRDDEYTLSELLGLGKFDQALSQLSEREIQLDADSHALLKLEVHSHLEEAVHKDHGDARTAALIRFINDYLNEYIYDNGVRKILADFHLKNEQSELAIRSLYKILEFPDSDDQITRIRSRINTLVLGHSDALFAEMNTCGW